MLPLGELPLEVREQIARLAPILFALHKELWNAPSGKAHRLQRLQDALRRLDAARAPIRVRSGLLHMLFDATTVDRLPRTPALPRYAVYEVLIAKQNVPRIWECIGERQLCPSFAQLLRILRLLELRDVSSPSAQPGQLERLEALIGQYPHDAASGEESAEHMRYLLSQLLAFQARRRLAMDHQKGAQLLRTVERTIERLKASAGGGAHRQVWHVTPAELRGAIDVFWCQWEEHRIEPRGVPWGDWLRVGVEHATHPPTTVRRMAAHVRPTVDAYIYDGRSDAEALLQSLIELRTEAHARIVLRDPSPCVSTNEVLDLLYLSFMQDWEQVAEELTTNWWITRDELRDEDNALLRMIVTFETQSRPTYKYSTWLKHRWDLAKADVRDHDDELFRIAAGISGSAYYVYTPRVHPPLLDFLHTAWGMTWDDVAAIELSAEARSVLLRTWR